MSFEKKPMIRPFEIVDARIRRTGGFRFPVRLDDQTPGNRNGSPLPTQVNAGWRRLCFRGLRGELASRFND
jgi:hypothetical protein